MAVGVSMMLVLKVVRFFSCCGPGVIPVSRGGPSPFIPPRSQGFAPLCVDNRHNRHIADITLDT